MNGDLERELAGDAELRALAASLRAAPQARVSAGFAAGVMAAVRAEQARRPRWRFRPVFFLPAAAAVAVCLALTGVFHRPASDSAAPMPAGQSAASPAVESSAAYLASCQRADGLFSESSAAPYMQAFAVTALAKDAKAPTAALTSAVNALVREQNAEGGWANASLSARNVAALHAASAVGVTGAVLAYKRGLRYLRTHGIVELSSADFVREAQAALARIDRADRALVCSATLCAN